MRFIVIPLSIVIVFLTVQNSSSENPDHPQAQISFSLQSQIESQRKDLHLLKADLADQKAGLEFIKERLELLEQRNSQILSMASQTVNSSHNSFEKVLEIHRAILFAIPTLLLFLFAVVGYLGYKSFKQVLLEAQGRFKQEFEDFKKESGEVLRTARVEHEVAQRDARKTLYAFKTSYLNTLTTLEEATRNIDQKMTELNIGLEEKDQIKSSAKQSFDRILYDHLVQIQNAGNEEMKIYAATRLGDLKTEEPIAALKSIIEIEGDTKVSASAIGALGKSKDSSLIPYLESLNDTIRSEYGKLALDWAKRQCAEGKVK